MAALKNIARAIRDSGAIMEVLSVLEPLALALVNNDGYKAFGNSNVNGIGGPEQGGVAHMIRLFEQLQAKGGPFDAGCDWIRDDGASYSDDEDTMD